MALTESCLLKKLSAWKPPVKEGCKEKFEPPPFVKPDASEEEKALARERKTAYMDNVKQAFANLTNGEPSDVYVALQPIFQISRGDYKLVGLEVLARPFNGSDAAPMPGMAEWQVQDREGAMAFLKKQLDFAAECAPKFPGVDISVNVRPDELLGAQEKVLEVSKKTPTLLIEITEYSPIDDTVIAWVRGMKGQGVRFALDDATKVVDDAPSNGYAKTGTHAGSFELGKKHADPFDV